MISVRHFTARVRWSRRPQYVVIRRLWHLIRGIHPSVVVAAALLALVYLVGHRLDLP